MQSAALQIPTSREGLVAGVDEAGRGPLAGPVAAAAVILDPGCVPAGLNDSKKLKATRREALAETIRDTALYWSVVMVDVDQIDQLNILVATMTAMDRAVARLGVTPDQVLVDGNRAPRCGGAPVQTLIGGDARHASIAAASILAKTHRDAAMVALDLHWPEYGFAAHKGYGTAAHLEALQRHGPTPQHRRSFAPVRAVQQTLEFD